MNENLNLVEILKDCPEGTKLYSIMHNEVKFSGIREDTIICKIEILGKTLMPLWLNCEFCKDGTIKGYPGVECVLFPSKDQRDWSKFKVEPEMIDGEFYRCFYGNKKENSFIFIYKKHASYKTSCYVALSTLSSVLFKDDLITNNPTELRKATEEEKHQLLDAIKIRNYKWDFVKKELIKIEPKFDITTFKPFDKVLVRDRNIDTWHCDLFDRLNDPSRYLFICIGGVYHQCIPYNNETKYLYKTNETPPKKYITWEE